MFIFSATYGFYEYKTDFPSLTLSDITSNLIAVIRVTGSFLKIKIQKRLFGLIHTSPARPSLPSAPFLPGGPGGPGGPTGPGGPYSPSELAFEEVIQKNG